MCGRYYMSDETIWEIERRTGMPISQLWRELRDGTRDICPSQYAIILRAEKDHLNAEKMRWGFPGFQGNGLLINARAESALQKKTYRDSVLNRRCVIPAKGFYEWNNSKEKFAFESAESPVIFLAGCFNWFESEQDFSEIQTSGTAASRVEKRFVILTTEARGRAAQIHERMPLLLRADEIRAWIFDDGKTEQFLHREPKEVLECKTDYEQLSLF